MDVEDGHSDRNKSRDREGDQKNSSKDKSMKELVALADQRLVEIARIYGVDAQVWCREKKSLKDTFSCDS